MNLLTWGILGLFTGTFLSATLLPFPSEALVVGFYQLDYPFWTVLIIATAGNLLGGLTNYYIGFKSNSERLIKRFKLNEFTISQWEQRLSKWGVWLGLLAWLPIIGDPMVAVLGFFKVKWIPLTVMMLIGKFLRYFFLLYFFEQLIR
ncbi:DedA family protein [Crocinitomix sp.]|nr:DedA family protein [Crocinitomix sp.]